MSRRRWSLAVALVLTGCATTDELTSRLASQEPGASIAVIPPRPGRERVQVSEEQFQATLRALVAEIRFPARLGSRAVPRVMPAAWTPLSHEELALARDYRLWCEHRHRMSDCLGLLRDRATLRPADRYKIAFDIALGSQWDGFTTELRGMVDPAVVRVTLLSALVGYMALIAFPELVTKGIAAGLALTLTSYLGAEAVWNLVAGWVRMVEEVDSARTFAQLRAAGERYGRAVGAQTARLLVMMVAAVLAEGGAASKLIALPGAAQANLALVADGGGLGLAAAGQATSVLVEASGVTVVLAPVTTGMQAVAMAASKDGGGGAGRKATPPGSSADENRGYKSFDAFKYANGPAGKDKVWHHIVEQHKDNVDKFGAEALHNRTNVIRLNHDIHVQVNRHYSSKPRPITGDKTVREWLKSQSYEAQREYGLKVLRRFGVEVP